MILHCYVSSPEGIQPENWKLAGGWAGLPRPEKCIGLWVRQLGPNDIPKCFWKVMFKPCSSHHQPDNGINYYKWYINGTYNGILMEYKQYGTVWYSMVQYGTVWYSMVQYGTVGIAPWKYNVIPGGCEDMWKPSRKPCDCIPHPISMVFEHTIFFVGSMVGSISMVTIWLWLT